MLLAKASIVIALIVALSAPVACGSARETNAQRMARGLPPLAPKFRRNMPGNGDGDRHPTPAGGGKYPHPSPLPPIPYSGRIEVRDNYGHPLGTVKNTNHSSTIGGLSFHGRDKELIVSFNAPFSGKGPFDILVTNPEFSEPFYVGAAGPAEGSILDPTNENIAAFTNVQSTPPSSIPTLSTFDKNLMVQSAIWSIDRRTKELSAQYINVDGSQPQTMIAYNDHENKLFFASSIDTYNDGHNAHALTVKFFLIPERGH